MGKINIGKVIAGGLVAGVILNVIDYVINMHLMVDQLNAVNAARNIDPAVAQAAMVPSIGIDFVLGLVLIFTYAAIRPRFGAGPKTAVIAAVIISGTADLMAGYFAAAGFFPWGLWCSMAVLSFINAAIAALAGGAIYTE